MSTNQMTRCTGVGIAVVAMMALSMADANAGGLFSRFGGWGGRNHGSCGGYASHNHHSYNDGCCYTQSNHGSHGGYQSHASHADAYGDDCGCGAAVSQPVYGGSHGGSAQQYSNEQQYGQTQDGGYYDSAPTPPQQYDNNNGNNQSMNNGDDARSMPPNPPTESSSAGPGEQTPGTGQTDR